MLILIKLFDRQQYAQLVVLSFGYRITAVYSMVMCIPLCGKVGITHGHVLCSTDNSPLVTFLYLLSYTSAFTLHI